MTIKAKFEILACCGEHVDFVEIDVDADIDKCYLCYEYTSEVFDAAGIDNHICDTCHDKEYRVEFVEFVESADYVI